MELIRTIKENSVRKKHKKQSSQLDVYQKQAEEVITLSDFDNELFIAYRGVPFVPINASWATKEIVEELSKLRQNYVSVKMKDFNEELNKQSIFRTLCW